MERHTVDETGDRQTNPGQQKEIAAGGRNRGKRTDSGTLTRTGAQAAKISPARRPQKTS